MLLVRRVSGVLVALAMSYSAITSDLLVSLFVRNTLRGLQVLGELYRAPATVVVSQGGSRVQ